MKKVEMITDQYVEAFKNYCELYRTIHDESYLTPDDLENFKIGKEDLTYLLLENNQIVGVLSFVMDAYHLSSKTTRIRIFHCIETIESNYHMLLERALPILEKIDSIEMFIPNEVEKTIHIIQNLGFEYNRTSYIMVRKQKQKLSYPFGGKYELKPFRKTIDEIHYQTIRNEAFKNIKGSEMPISIQMVEDLYNESDLLEDGMLILWDQDQPIGIIRVILEKDETGDYGFIAPLALLPEYQGKGLGTKLLQAGIVVGQEHGLDDSMLAVNAENELALRLYLKQGYEILFEISNFRRANKAL